MITNNRPIAIKRKKPVKKVTRISRNKVDDYLKNGLGSPLRRGETIAKIGSAKQLNAKFKDIRPLKDVMKAGLRAKGISAPNDLPVLSNKFYNEVVRPHKKTAAGSTFGESYKEVDVSSCAIDSVDPAKDAIFSGITEFIRSVKDKAADGRSLSKVEDVVYNTTVAVENEAEKKAKAGAAQSVGEKILFDPTTRLVLIGVVGIMLFAVLK